MKMSTKLQKNKLMILVLIFSFILGSTNGINSSASPTSTIPIQTYQVANPLTVFQRDQLNVSLSITNTYFQAIYNVTVFVEIHEDLEFLFSSEPDVNTTFVNDSTKIEYPFGTLEVNGIILFSLTYNVTSSETKTIEIPSMKTSFELQNGIPGNQFSNGVSVFLKGKRIETRVTTLPPTPKGEIEAPLFLILAGYSVPIIIFALSAFILRRVIN
ncbi:MAG: hypothetical protein ACW97X_00675 [Candidatus Hodarchaeales archaeon]